MESKVYQKGQIVIRAELRKKYGIEIGGTVNVIPEKNYLKIVPLRKRESIIDIAGCFKSEKPFPSKKELDKSSEKSYVKDYRIS